MRYSPMRLSSFAAIHIHWRRVSIRIVSDRASSPMPSSGKWIATTMAAAMPVRTRKVSVSWPTAALPGERVRHPMPRSTARSTSSRNRGSSRWSIPSGARASLRTSVRTAPSTRRAATAPGTTRTTCAQRSASTTVATASSGASTSANRWARATVPTSHPVATAPSEMAATPAVSAPISAESVAGPAWRRRRSSRIRSVVIRRSSEGRNAPSAKRGSTRLSGLSITREG
ncbi:hypothetical protein ACFQ9X_15465 [Catenulispora yoronensis]